MRDESVERIWVRPRVMGCGNPAGPGSVVPGAIGQMDFRGHAALLHAEITVVRRPAARLPTAIARPDPSRSGPPP